MGVDEFETGADDGTVTGTLTGAGGGGGAMGASAGGWAFGGLMKEWWKKVLKSSRSLASLFSNPYNKLVNSADVPLGILKTANIYTLRYLFTPKKFREN